MEMNNQLSPTGLIVGIAGSPRAGGNTDLAMEQAKNTTIRLGFAFQVIYLRDFHIKPCGSCGECNTRTSMCAQSDEIPWIIERLLLADGIIYAAPVYGFGTSHLMQMFIERAGVGYLRFSRPLRNKVGAVIVTGRRYNHLHVYNQLVLNMLLNHLIVPGSGFPCILHGGRPGKAIEDTEGMTAIEQTVARMVEIIVALRNTSIGDHPRSDLLPNFHNIMVSHG
jgi:multimeric flavodoxin WrbA